MRTHKGDFVSQLRPSTGVRCRLRGGKNDLTKKRMNPKTRGIFLEGLKRYRERGVRVLLDGKEVEIDDLEVIFEEQPDGSFYMGDYVLEDEHTMREALPGGQKVRENQAEYGNETICRRRRSLKEIRFDRVYNR